MNRLSSLMLGATLALGVTLSAQAQVPQALAEALRSGRLGYMDYQRLENLRSDTEMRKGIAAQMTRALSIPHAYVSLEVDVTNLVLLRESLKREYQAREGISLSFVPFVVKACVEALRRNPTINAHWTDAGLLAKRRINVGVAVAVDDGLLVPVIRDVDALSINGINHAIADVAARARAGKLRLEDFGGFRLAGCLRDGGLRGLQFDAAAEALRHDTRSPA